MALREIVTLPDPVLRKKAHKVTVFDKDFQTLVEDMIETMRLAPGVGLAANQIGLLTRLIVVEYGEEGDEDETPAPKKLYVVANPEIIQESTEVEIGIEACLSVPGLVGEVERSTKIVVKGLNRLGRPTRIRASGWLARIFQHEIDHLNGVIFTDLATKVWKPTKEEELPISD
jgi:peptide deformylase